MTTCLPPTLPWPDGSENPTRGEPFSRSVSCNLRLRCHVSQLRGTSVSILHASTCKCLLLNRTLSFYLSYGIRVNISMATVWPGSLPASVGHRWGQREPGCAHTLCRGTHLCHAGASTASHLCRKKRPLSALLQNNSRIWEEKGDRAVQ